MADFLSMEPVVVPVILDKGFLAVLFPELLCVEMKPVVVVVVVEPITELRLFLRVFVFLVEVVEIRPIMTPVSSKNPF
jgi:hypothetical protein